MKERFISKFLRVFKFLLYNLCLQTITSGTMRPLWYFSAFIFLIKKLFCNYLTHANFLDGKKFTVEQYLSNKFLVLKIIELV